MNKEQLISALDALSLNRVTQATAIIENNNPHIGDLLDLSFHQKKEIAFRAAWMLEYCLTFKAALFSPYLSEFINLLPKQSNPSALRHYAKMIALITDKKADQLYRELLADIDFSAVIESFFTLLIDPHTLVATKVHCMQSLANLAPRYEWIRDELAETIYHLVNTESIAFFARAKKIEKQLKKI